MTLATTTGAELVEQTVIGGDLAKLSPQERLAYYRRVCDSLGLNYLTQPFAYITLNSRLTLYAKRDCTDQLRKLHGINVAITGRDAMGDSGVYVVTARATDRGGREDESIGAVSITGLKGDALANALMKCETKAKRRVTLSIVGLGWLDETEVGTIPQARAVVVDAKTGEITDPAPTSNGAAPNGHALTGHAIPDAYRSGAWVTWMQKAADQYGLDLWQVAEALGDPNLYESKDATERGAIAKRQVSDWIEAQTA